MTLLLALIACRNKDLPVDSAEPVDSEIIETDYDGDGYPEPEDCDDQDASAYPGAAELCDDVDNDCDGEIDEEVLSSWYPDVDGDGYGDAALGQSACEAPSGYVADATDCDDRDDEVNPGATEVCNEVDDDCDGEVDEEVELTWYADSDGDGEGDAATTIEACAAPAGYVADADDCDDTDASVSPNATEICNEIDDDCDGTVDEDDAADAGTWYADSDGDGYGDPDSSSEACGQPSGSVSNSRDCDDSDADANPDTTWYADADGDGYGNPDLSVQQCEQPSGFLADDSDCDDSDASLNPDTEWFEDGDGDGYGDADSSSSQCEQPSGYVSDDTDCDDDEGDVNPGEDEQCDDVDHDCDGDVGLSSCEDCAAILAADSSSADGVYEIDLDGAGGDDAFEVYCDMTLDGGGWTLWWWFESGSSMSGVTDVLGEEELWDCDPSSDTSCLSPLPTGSPDELLVENQDGDWAVWEFDSTTTASNALAAFTSGTTTTRSSSYACNDAWSPVAQSGAMTDTPYSCDENNNDGGSCKCFWYASYGGVYSFYLDDDTGWAETAFGAGYDNSGSLGVDSLETTYRYNATTHSLWLYWR